MPSPAPVSWRDSPCWSPAVGPSAWALLFFPGWRARVLVADMRAERLAFCADQLGVETVAVTPDVTETLRDRTNGVFHEVVFDATGSPPSIETQFAHVASGGTYVIVSVVKGDIVFSDAEFHRRELTLRASRNALPADFETVVAAMRAGNIPSAALKTHSVALEDLPAAMPSLIDPTNRVIKALVEIA